MVSESFETGPENIDNSSDDGSKEEDRKIENKTPELNVEKLKGVYEKCTKEPEDEKHGTPLWQVHVTLGEDELSEIRSLESHAKTQLEKLTANEPLWDKFVALEKEGVDKGVLWMTGAHGVGKKDYYGTVVASPDATEVTKTKTETGLPAIEVPPRIAGLVGQRNRLDNFKFAYAQQRGTMAGEFGDTLKETYRFYKGNK